MGEPRTWISRSDTRDWGLGTGTRRLLACRSRGFGGRGCGEHLRDAAALDDQARLVRLDRYAVVHRCRLAFAFLLTDVHDLADNAARRHDLVSTLEVSEPLLVVLPLLLLRPDHHEVEDREDRDDLENEGEQRRAPAGGSLNE